MRRMLFGWAASIVILSGLVPVARAATQNRVVGGAETATAVLPGSVVPRVSKATDLGEANGETVLPMLSLRFNMTAAQQSALTQSLIDQQNPTSPRYRQWLTPEQFADRFGLSTADVAKVAQWLTGQGFKIESVARSRTFIQFSGTVAQAEAAFRTNIHRVSLAGEEHLANVNEVALPARIAGVVGGVTGLNDFRLKPRARTHMVQANADPKFTSSISGETFMAPADFATIYDTKPLLTSSINGTGITIAIAGQTDISLTDVAAFRAAAGLSANPPTVKVYGSDPGTSSTDIDEAQLDVEWSGAVAPAATILYVNSKDVLDTSLTQIVDNDLAPIASVSYGDCESATGQMEINTLNALFMQANAQGQTIVGPAGDSGATDCDYKSSIATGGLAVDFPASSPYVTGVGGSMFSEGSGTYWATTNGAGGESALSYIPEDVWNESLEKGSTELEAGGGGVSSVFTKPAWQTGAGVPNDFARDVPDVSLNADPDHDGYLFCAQGSCVNGFRTSATPTASCTTGNCLDVVGGTSASTPSFAGILALVQQKIGATVGNANPVIYALANSTYYNTVFHDIQTGNNESPCQTGSTDCPSGGDIGYTAGVGYDLASGWGSVDAFNLANDWTLVTPGTSASGLPSTTTVTASAESVTSGTSVTITATVADASTDPVSTAGPTGTVQFLVDNVASGVAVTLTPGSTGSLQSTATFTLATASLTSGSHTVSATYSGDTTYAGSKGSVIVDVTSATAPDFTLTPATATVTATAGADAPGIVYTVTPINGFTGPVTFTASTTSATLNATYSFTVTPLTVTAPTAGSTTLDLSAYVSKSKSGTTLARHTIGLAATRRPEQPGAKHGTPWYAGSGAALAGLVLLMAPRRRRMGALLGLVVSIAVLGGMMGVEGCGSGTNGNATSQVNATPGTYTIIVAATGTSAGITVSHNATVTFVVQ